MSGPRIVFFSLLALALIGAVLFARRRSGVRRLAANKSHVNGRHSDGAMLYSSGFDGGSAGSSGCDSGGGGDGGGGCD